MTEAVKEYALAATLFCIAAGICEILITDSNGSIGRYVRYVISLCVAAVILLPVGKAFVGNITDIGSVEVTVPAEQRKSDAAETVIRVFKEEIEEKAAQNAEKNFSLGSGEVSVSVMLDTSELTSVRLIAAYAYLSGNAAGLAEEISEYLKEQLGCTVTAIVN